MTGERSAPFIENNAVEPWILVRSARFGKPNHLSDSAIFGNPAAGSTSWALGMKGPPGRILNTCRLKIPCCLRKIFV